MPVQDNSIEPLGSTPSPEGFPPIGPPPLRSHLFPPAPGGSYASTVPQASPSVSSGIYTILPNTAYVVMASMLAGTVLRSCTLGVQWYNGPTLLSSATIQTANDSTSAWTAYSGTTALSPSNANGVKITMSITNALAGETHYLDEVGLFPAGATSWTIGGWSGLTYCQILRSDNVYVRWASSTNPLPLGATASAPGYWVTLNPALQQSIVWDYEVTPLTSYSYQAVTIITTPPLSSASATSGVVDYDPENGWWEFNPLNPATATNAQFISWTPTQIEQSSANQVLNQTTPNVVANAILNQEFAAEAETFSATIYAAFNALLTSQQTVFISSPWGAMDSGYFRIGPSSTSGGGGSGTAAKNTTLHPSTTNAPHRNTSIQAVPQLRPAV